MSTPVVMPQMGESIAEGTIVRWIKKVGEAVDRDEPLFEISTDKVDAEIPAPAAGVLTEIKVKEGETVPVNAVVATIGEASEVAASSRRPAQAPPQPRSVQADGDGPVAEESPGDAQAEWPRGQPRTASRSPVAAPSHDDVPSSEVVAARPPHREGTQRRHLADSRLRSRRPRDQARHPRVHRDPARKSRRRARNREPRARLRAPTPEPKAPAPEPRAQSPRSAPSTATAIASRSSRSR